MQIFSPVKSLKKYFHTLVTIHSSPLAIAFGTALGIYVGFTPFIGLQTVLGVVLATLFGCNRLAAAIGVNLHTPILWLWPGVFALEYKIGQWILGSHSFPPFSMSHLTWSTTFEVGLPILLGSFIVGIPVAALSFWFLFAWIKRYQEKHSYYHPNTAPKEKLSDLGPK